MKVSELSAAHSRLRQEHDNLTSLCLSADLARLQSLVKVVEARSAAADMPGKSPAKAALLKHGRPDKRSVQGHK